MLTAALLALGATLEIGGADDPKLAFHDPTNHAQVNAEVEWASSALTIKTTASGTPAARVTIAATGGVTCSGTLTAADLIIDGQATTVSDVLTKVSLLEGQMRALAKMTNQARLTMSAYTYAVGLGATATTAMAFGMGAFTVEMWIKPMTTSVRWQWVWGCGGSHVADSGVPWINLEYGTTPTASRYDGGTYPKVAGPAIKTNAWSHIALVRDSNGSTTMYSNGVGGTASPVYNGVDLQCNNARLGDNTAFPSGEWFDGGVYSSFRSIKGTARYMADFTPTVLPDCDVGTSSTCYFIEPSFATASYRYWRLVLGTTTNGHMPRTADVSWVTTAGSGTQGTTPPQTNTQNCADQGWIGGSAYGISSPIGNWDLGAATSLSSVKFYSVFGAAGRGMMIQVQGSNDASTWANVGAEFDYNTGAGGCGYYEYPLRELGT